MAIYILFAAGFNFELEFKKNPLIQPVPNKQFKHIHVFDQSKLC